MNGNCNKTLPFSQFFQNITDLIRNPHKLDYLLRMLLLKHFFCCSKFIKTTSILNLLKIFFVKT